VDIELEQRMSDFLEVALQIATPRKTSLLMSRSGGQLRAAFFDLWTRKEALLKAARTGLLSDPRDVSFEGRNWTLDSLVGSAPAQALPWQSRGC
jgi:phosphopantetheinyl transferase